MPGTSARAAGPAAPPPMCRSSWSCAVNGSCSIGQVRRRKSSSGARELAAGLDEFEHLAGKLRVRRVDRVDFRHVAVLRQDQRADASAFALAERLRDGLELLDEL